MNLFTYHAPYIVEPFEKHDEFKTHILKFIEDDAPFHRYRLQNENSDIYTDYGLPFKTVKYYDLLEESLLDHTNKVSHIMGYDYGNIEYIWYQQYLKNGKHGWHVHQGCTFTSVYYVEYPVGSPPTEFKDLITKEVIAIDSVKEGDILTFPSYILHRASENQTENRKTILSWHSNVFFSKKQ